jgi:hypothetical protein
MTETLENMEESMREDWLEEVQRHRFPDVLRDYMDARDIESLEALHALYLEAGGKFDLPTFRRHARGEAGVLTPEFISPLFDALGLSVTGARGEQSSSSEGNALLLAYGLAYSRLPQER